MGKKEQQAQPPDEMFADLGSDDLYNENIRLRRLNGKLTNANLVLTGVSAIAVIAAVIAFATRPAPDRIAVDKAGRVFPLQLLEDKTPSDARVTRMVSDCVTDLLNQAFHNYQTRVEETIARCITDAGSPSVRTQIDPLLARMKSEQSNLATTFVIQPFIDHRVLERGRYVFKVQAIAALGYRSRSQSSTPINYSLECDVVRVSYEENIEGIKLQNVVLKIKT